MRASGGLRCASAAQRINTAGRGVGIMYLPGPVAAAFPRMLEVEGRYLEAEPVNEDLTLILEYSRNTERDM